jgi:hypothetical protein
MTFSEEDKNQSHKHGTPSLSEEESDQSRDRANFEKELKYMLKNNSAANSSSNKSSSERFNDQGKKFKHFVVRTGRYNF